MYALSMKVQKELAFFKHERKKLFLMAKNSLS